MSCQRSTKHTKSNLTTPTYSRKSIVVLDRSGSMNYGPSDVTPYSECIRIIQRDLVDKRLTFDLWLFDHDVTIHPSINRIHDFRDNPEGGGTNIPKLLETLIEEIESNVETVFTIFILTDDDCHYSPDDYAPRLVGHSKRYFPVIYDIGNRSMEKMKKVFGKTAGSNDLDEFNLIIGDITNILLENELRIQKIDSLREDIEVLQQNYGLVQEKLEQIDSLLSKFQIQNRNVHNQLTVQMTKETLRELTSKKTEIIQKIIKQKGEIKKIREKNLEVINEVRSLDKQLSVKATEKIDLETQIDCVRVVDESLCVDLVEELKRIDKEMKDLNQEKQRLMHTNDLHGGKINEESTKVDVLLRKFTDILKEKS